VLLYQLSYIGKRGIIERLARVRQSAGAKLGNAQQGLMAV
jgi:hypothetical protein